MPVVLIGGLQTVLCYALVSPNQFRAIVRDARYLRIAHYTFLFALGLVVAGERVEWGLFATWVRVVLAFCALTFAWIFAVMNNNIYDLELDRINAPERPLVTGEVNFEQYRKETWWVGALALLFAGTISTIALMMVMLFCAAYFVYSSPPVRLKRRCLVSKFVIGLNSGLSFVLGCCLFSLRLDAPAGWVWLVAVWFSLGAHIIDLKDVEGDAAAGIKNFSTMLGVARAKKVFGVGALLAYLGVAYAVGGGWLTGFLMAIGVAMAIVINRRVYSEVPVLVLQASVTVAVIAYQLAGAHI